MKENIQLKPITIIVDDLESLFQDKLISIELEDNSLSFVYNEENSIDYIGNEQGLILEDKYDNSIAVTKDIIKVIADEDIKEQFSSLISFFAI